MKKIFPIILFSASILFVDAQPVTKSMKRLPDTGQNTSYTNTFGEDSDFNIYVPYYNINGNGTVTDTITGLMWQKTDGGEMTIENAAIYCNTLTLGGYSDWRLPNCHELFSILNHDRVNPSEDTIYFTKTLAEYWWSSQRQVGDTSKVWVTNAGGGVGNHPKTETISAGGPKKFHVRAVRDIATPILIPNHFINNGNGTITDQITNLTWQQIQYADTLTWENALIYADTLSLSGYTDWRLPNIKELQSINDETITNPSIKSVYFGVNTAKKYWSSTSLPNQTTRAWYLDTQFGITTYANKTNKINLLCVRGNQINTTGIIENKISMQDVTVFPNPFSTTINIVSSYENAEFDLYNSFGESVFSGKNIKSQNFSYLPQGVYTLKVTDNRTKFIKLIKN
jgi:hypothetical protein